jgi:hypothetical protein
VNLTSGWVSIQSTSSPNNCIFNWLSSPEGNNNAMQYDDFLGPSPYSLGVNLAFALTGKPPVVPVGGEAYPVSKASILSPWIALVLTIAAVSILLVRRRALASK